MQFPLLFINFISNIFPMSFSSPLHHVLYVSPGSLSEYNVHAMRYVVRVRSTPTVQTKTEWWPFCFQKENMGPMATANL